jgi:hypothetical protein
MHAAEHAHGTDARPAVLELGREVGAAVIYTTAALDQTEIEIRPHHAEWDGTHTAVRKRPGEPAVFAALFFGLRSGHYDVRVRDTGIGRPIHVVGGQVTEAELS